MLFFKKKKIVLETKSRLDKYYGSKAVSSLRMIYKWSADYYCGWMSRSDTVCPKHPHWGHYVRNYWRN